jgi:hypothetical protein
MIPFNNPSKNLNINANQKFVENEKKKSENKVPKVPYNNNGLLPYYIVN